MKEFCPIWKTHFEDLSALKEKLIGRLVQTKTTAHAFIVLDIYVDLSMTMINSFDNITQVRLLGEKGVWEERLPYFRAYFNFVEHSTFIR